MTSKDLTAVCAELTTVVKECSLSVLEHADQFPKAFAMAKGIRQLRTLITPELMKEIMPLMNTSLGFLTDKDPARPKWNKDKGKYEEVKPYSEDVVKECFIEATLRGLSPVGNEWNIISSRAYVTKAGFARKLKELNGFTDFKPVFQTPKPNGDGSLVQASASWKMNGIPDSLERIFVIKVNFGMGSDAVIGKAERKLRAAVYEQITGSHLSEGDAADDDAIPTTATKTTADLNDKLKTAETLSKLRGLPPQVLAHARGKLNILGDIEKMSAEDQGRLLVEAESLMATDQ